MVIESKRAVWSGWYDWDDKKVLEKLKNQAGIYEVQTDIEFGRLRGCTRTVTIGRTKKLYQRRVTQKAKNPGRNSNRAEKWLVIAGHKLKFRYCICNSPDDELLEAIGLWEFENKHWELPPGNNRLEKAPIRKLIESVFQGGVPELVKNLDNEEMTTAEVAKILDLPEAIITNIRVYKEI
jgi:hypothetical protein